MKMYQFLGEIKELYRNYFPNSSILCRFSSNLYSSIWVQPYIAGDKKELSGGYYENDMLAIKFMIDTDNGEFGKNIDINSEINDINLVLHVEGNFYYIKPIYNKYNCYDHTSLKYRKTRGDYKKILSILDKYFKQLKDSLIANLENNNIHKNHADLLLTKLGY